jgi:hypothetical protein
MNESFLCRIFIFIFSEIINAIPELDYICVDVANGYSEHFVEFVRLVRREFPEKTIFVCDLFYFFIFLFCIII